MAWWIWVLIGVGVVALGALKISVFKKILSKKKETKRFTEED